MKIHIQKSVLGEYYCLNYNYGICSRNHYDLCSHYESIFMHIKHNRDMLYLQSMVLTGSGEALLAAILSRFAARRRLASSSCISLSLPSLQKAPSLQYVFNQLQLQQFINAFCRHNKLISSLLQCSETNCLRTAFK